MTEPLMLPPTPPRRRGVACWAAVAGIACAVLVSRPAAAQGDAGQGTDDQAAEAAGEDSAGADAEMLDIQALRQEYLRLRDELFRSRARAAAVASTLYSTKIRIELRYDSARFYTVTRATIRLDGANVFDDSSGAIAADNAPRFEGFVAPGRHLVSIRIEATGKDDERFTSVMEHTVALQAPAGKDVIVTARAKDSGDIPYAWEKSQRGSYKLRLDVSVDTEERPEPAGQDSAQGASSRAARPGARQAAAMAGPGRPGDPR